MASGAVRAKVVMAGAPEVGKSSLVRRFVDNVFSDGLASTIGVKVDRKIVAVGTSMVTMLLWDLHGETDGLDVPDHYLKGAGGALVVFDASRPETIPKAIEMFGRIQTLSPRAAIRFVGNKSDLQPDWAAIDEAIAGVEHAGLIRTSALTGESVEAAFTAIATAVAK